MKSISTHISSHIDRVQRQPHHIKKHFAFTVSAIGTGFIALVWFVGNASLGTFALSDTSFASTVAQDSSPVDRVSSTDSSLLAGAAASMESKDTTPHIQIVDLGSSVTSHATVEPTILPF